MAGLETKTTIWAFRESDTGSYVRQPSTDSETVLQSQMRESLQDAMAVLEDKPEVVLLDAVVYDEKKRKDAVVFYGIYDRVLQIRFTNLNNTETPVIQLNMFSRAKFDELKARQIELYDGKDELPAEFRTEASKSNTDDKKWAYEELDSEYTPHVGVLMREFLGHIPPKATVVLQPSEDRRYGIYARLVKRAERMRMAAAVEKGINPEDESQYATIFLVRPRAA